MPLEQIQTRSLTETEKQSMRDSNDKIVRGIMQKIASHNIHNPYFSRIQVVFDDMSAELEERMTKDFWAV